MRIQVDLSTLGQTKWQDYAVRFLFGGLITALAGIIAKKFGPGIGGLFLAFPAIFPASATLIEKHEKEKKESLGLKGEARGRSAASIDARRLIHGKHRVGCLCDGRFVFHVERSRMDRSRGGDGSMAGSLGGGLADSKGAVGHDSEYCSATRLRVQADG
jgi:hypothetical protein